MSTHHTPLYRDTPLILSVSGVTKAFDGFKAIDDLNFYLEEGELRTIIGPNGAGKSTFMDIITGRTRPDVGSVTMHEKDGRDYTGEYGYPEHRWIFSTNWEIGQFNTNMNISASVRLSVVARHD